MEHISDLFGTRRILIESDSKKTERGELMKMFMEKLNEGRKASGFAPLTMGRMGRIFESISTGDLYALEKKCEGAKDFSKKFWWELDPKKHTKEDKK